MNTALRRLAVLCTLAAPVVVSAQSQAPVERSGQKFRSSADLVTIQASVRDSRGRVVHGLTAADFDVRDNGQPRPVISLRSDRQSPVSVAILIDTSGSMRLGANVEMARQAYDSVLAQLRAGRDEVAVFTFDSSVHVEREFTRDVGSLRGAMPDIKPFGVTSLYDATAETARRLAARSSTHKAIIVLTDGIDTASKMTAAQVSGVASSIDVPVFVMATVPSIDRRLIVEATETISATQVADLRNLADWTGGQLFLATTHEESLGAASSVVMDLRQQYVLAIEAAPARQWRRLEVSVKRRPAVVRARSGYFGG